MTARRRKLPLSARCGVVVAALVSGSLPATAGAYCRTTTCDPRFDDCEYDSDGCNTTGEYLFWDTSCVTYSIEKGGSSRRDIEFDQALEIIDDSFQNWEEAVCEGGQSPFVGFTPDRVPASSTEPEFELEPGNDNVWLFRDEEWPHVGIGHALALSSVTFDADTGRILDVDVELNTFQFPITISDSRAESDFQSIVTHEAGHFLGLDHSRVPGATMFENYSPGNLDFRTLESDDEAGICAIYPPTTPRACVDDPIAALLSNGSSDSGCAVAPGPASPSMYGSSIWLALGALVARSAHRRRRRRLS